MKLSNSLFTLFGLLIALPVLAQAATCSKPIIATGDKETVSFLRGEVIYTIQLNLTTAGSSDASSGEDFVLFKDDKKIIGGHLKLFNQTCNGEHSEVAVFALDRLESRIYPLKNHEDFLPVKGPPGSLLFIFGKTDGFSVEIDDNEGDAQPLVTMLPTHIIWKRGIISPLDMKSVYDAQYGASQNR